MNIMVLDDVTILVGDSRQTLRELPAESVHCCVTSPPYWGLRDYGHDGQIGLEQTPEAYVAELVEVFREVKRVLRDDGTLWLNLGDTYANSGQQHPQKNLKALADKMAPRKNPRKANCDTDGLVPRAVKHIPPNLKPKDLVGIPWRVAFALQADGWWLRQDIIWHKPNPMPESVTDRCTKAHEYIFLLSKSAKYWYDADAVRESCSSNSHGSPNVNPGQKVAELAEQGARNDATGGALGKWTAEDKAKGRNRRSVWTIATAPYSAAHFATFPPKLIEPCILAGCPVGGTVLDPFGGSGTTAGVAVQHNRKAILCELNPEYAALVGDRVKSIAGDYPMFD
jgi:DNA modification methylase